MQSIAKLTINALRAHGTEALPFYETTLAASCAEHPPVFGTKWYGDTYRASCRDSTWFANSLAQNADKEGFGARVLWDMAGRTPDPHIAEQIRVHAVDESRHAGYYVSMLKLTFPNSLDEDQLKALRSLSPGFGSGDQPAGADEPSSELHILDELIQINIGEIRTRLQQVLMKPVLLAYCPDANKEKILAIMDLIQLDETRHVAYTSRILNAAARAGHAAFIAATSRRRWQQFNDLTRDEVASGVFEA